MLSLKSLYEHITINKIFSKLLFINEKKANYQRCQTPKIIKACTLFDAFLYNCYSYVIKQLSTCACYIVMLIFTCTKGEKVLYE